MKRLSSCSIGGTGLALLVSMGLGSWAYGQCANDAGSGDFAEGEACLVDLAQDTTNSGCNDDPANFTTLATVDFTSGVVDICASASNYDVAADCDVDADCTDLNCVGDPVPGDGIEDGTCVGAAEPSVSRRDTDWYMIPQSVLTDHDADANGVVGIRSSFFATGELDTVTFLIGITDPGGTCDTDVLASVGCNAVGGEGCTTDADCPSGTCTAGTCTSANNTAEEVLIIADYPDGVVVFGSPGMCSGAGIFNGFECSTLNNDYILEIEFFEVDSDCKPGPPQGPCNEPNQAAAGCEDPNCCALVCGRPGLAFCCVSFWAQACASAAIDLGCAPEPGGPVNMATGPDADQAIDGYLRVKADPFGSFADTSFGGTPGGGDLYNPAGDDAGGFGPAAATFSNGYYFFIAATNQRQILANNPDWQDSIATPDDGDIDRAIIIKNQEFDEDPVDGITDRMTSQFEVTGPGVDLTFDLEQKVANPDAAIATLTQTYTITNNLATPIVFDMNRQFDGDFVWLPGGSTATDDSTGTTTNGVATHVWVFMQEVGTAATAVTHSAAVGPGGFGAEYCGAKQFVNPNAADPDCLPYDFGSDTEEWEAYGLPDCWVNHVALVGYGLNGTSGNPAGADDVHTVLVQTVTVPGSSSVVMEMLHTYGQQEPYGLAAAPCPCDCNNPTDGVVNVQDFLALLAQWGGAGSCDCNNPPDGVVNVQDFLQILATWGNCP